MSDPVTSPPALPPMRRAWSTGVAALILAAGGVVFLATQRDDVSAAADTTQAATVKQRADAAPAPVPVPVLAPAPPVETSIRVQRHDTLSAVFGRAGVPARELQALLDSAEAALPLRKIYPGQTLVLQLRDNALIRVVYRPDILRTWIVERTADGYAGRWEKREFDRRVVTRRLEIESSLYQSALGAGLSENLILQVADIFGWDIDFALDIRRGDRMALVHEELWLDGVRVRDGAVLAARFINDGRTHEALRFERPDGTRDYYDPQGRSMRKEFLRTPVDFRRISSRFQTARWHPALGVKRPHRGVDYAASPGTPVRVTGDGKVVQVGNQGGYGRTVMVRHGEATQTLYAHLQGYAKSLQVGQRVRQGQVIGYVGSSGLSTGPHLHYEFQVGGVHRNPLTVKLPDAAPLPEPELPRLAEAAGPLRDQLDRLLDIRLAQAN